MRAACLSRPFSRCVRSLYGKAATSTTAAGVSSSHNRLIEKARRLPDRFGTLSPVESKKWSDDVLKELDDGDEDDDVKTVDFLDRKERTRLRPIQYARIIKQFLNDKKLEEAIDVLENRMLKKEKAQPDTYIYNLLISGCARNGQTKKAFQLFNQMKKRGLIVKDSTYTSLFNACSTSEFKGDGLRRAIKLCDLMLEKGHRPNETTCHAMIKAFGRCGDIERAFAVADEMLDRRLQITTGTINFLLQSCVSNRESGFRMGVEVWRKMIKLKLKPTIYTFNLMLRCVRDCEFGQLTDVNSLNEDVEEQDDCHKSSQTNDAAVATRSKNELSELSRNGDALSKSLRKPWNRLELLGGREAFLQLMTSAAVQPDVKTFTLLLDVVPPSTQIEDTLIQEMMKKGVKIDTDFCNLLIRKRSLTSRPNDAKKILDLINSEKLKPNIMTYGVLALSCTNLREAKQLLSDIEEAGFRVNIEILGGLIKGACQNWDFFSLRYLLQELMKQELMPSDVLIRQLKAFEDEVNRQLKIKESGGSYRAKLDKRNFIEEWQAFEKIINKLLLLRGRPRNDVIKTVKTGD